MKKKNNLAECVFVSSDIVEKSLEKTPEQGKRLLEPLKQLAQNAVLPINILEDHQVDNEAEVHRHEGDLWYCLQGPVEFVVGGELVDPWAKELPDGGIDDRELKANEIRGGTSHTLTEGDILWIPAGQPHLHKASGTARMFIIKIPAVEMASLESVPGWSV